MTDLLRVSDLSVRMATDDGPVQAVHDMSFALGAGEILALVGESGCGKSVTALSIAGLLPAVAEVTSGTIELESTDLLALSPRRMRDVRGKDVSMVFQEPMTSLNPVLTVGRQIEEVLRRHERLSKAAARKRAVELLATVGIPAAAERLKDYPHQLSGGMRQRVMIAIALACSPRVLLADEPTTALDVTIQAGILETLRDLRDEFGTAMVLITHDLGVVADIADRVVVMYAGRKIEEASTQELFRRPQHPYIAGLLGAVPRRGTQSSGRRRLQDIPGVVPTLTAPPTCCVFHPRCSRATDVCRTQLPPLEEHGDDHRVACFHTVNAVGEGATHG